MDDLLSKIFPYNLLTCIHRQSCHFFIIIYYRYTLQPSYTFGILNQVIHSNLSFVDQVCCRLSVFVQPSFSMFFWLLVSWCIWWSRNNLVFCNKNWVVKDILNSIKTFDWDSFSIIANKRLDLENSKNKWWSRPFELVGV